jgi:hypothetical protein
VGSKESKESKDSKEIKQPFSIPQPLIKPLSIPMPRKRSLGAQPTCVKPNHETTMSENSLVKPRRGTSNSSPRSSQSKTIRLELEPNPKRVKKDVLWKPLLRGFRAWVRSQITQKIQAINLFNNKGEVREEVV